MKVLSIKGARQHNLKNINIDIPRDKLVVVTGLSGSGKSTLAFDTIYAEGQRRYVESLSAYARQFLGLMNKPDVDSIEGLSPAISIDQKTTSKNPRSTVGTITEIYDYLRLLFARVGTPFCPDHNIKITKQSPQAISEQIALDFKNDVIILSPVVRKKKGTYEQLLIDLNKNGYMRVRIDGVIHRTDEKVNMDRYKMHDIDVVIDRVTINDEQRLSEAVESAIKYSKGLVIVQEGLEKQGTKQHNIKANIKDNTFEKIYSSNMSCPECGMVFEELQPRMFSFNSPFGACEECSGLGIKMDFDPDLIIPDKNKSIADGAISVYRNAIDGWRGKYLGAVAKHHGFSVFTPIKEFTKEQYDALMYGSDDQIKFNISMKNGDAQWSHKGTWEGLIPQSERLYQQTESDYRRKELEKFMRVSACPSCDGNRLKRKVLSVKVSDKSIIEVTNMSIRDSLEFFENLKLNSKNAEIAKQILKEIRSRLEFLEKVGLNYLTLSRGSATLSGGEAQRIRLATQIGSNLVGVLYILDEPSIGLHQRNNHKLISTLKRLRDLGNTLIVVEHDEDTIRSADYVIDIGPGAGIHGGKIIAHGTPEEIEQNPESLTGKYMSGQLSIDVPKSRRKPKKFMNIIGCKEHNLKNIDVKIPLSVLTLITGVSGSGKSTLIYDIMYKALMKKLHGSKMRPGKHNHIENGKIDKVIVIDQSPIGKTPRSNPATYTKVFDEIRKLFASTQEAKVRGYSPGRFSFNVKGGRCEACQGDGLIKIEMNFLPDVFVQCEECKGQRYNKETLAVKYKGKSISDILNMSVEEALELFKNIPILRRKLNLLNRVGLEYIKLGQSSITLSGGEAQRIKLTRELSKKDTGKTLYLLDEPTTGLHFHDVKKLIKVLNDLVDKGNSVVVIEHNLDVVKSADHVIDLGPEGGDEGGYIVAEGTPEEIAKEKKSYTGQYIKGLLIND
ncbi:excinuclease ABC subunit UvrA [Candidatus Woesearchaeota archaeon]|nr:excinuclease ABC subunit UvrA [Candidatus Woesearchaeota archaeon]